MHTLDGYDVRGAVLGLVAQHLKPSAFLKATTPVSDGAFRRLAQKVDLELLARFAKADCHGRARRLRLLGDGLVPRARARARRRARGRRRRSCSAAHLLALGVPPGPRMGELLRQIYEKQLDGEVTTLDEGLALARRLLEPV